MVEDVEDQLRSEFPIAMREVPFIECGGGWGELIRECVAVAERAAIPLAQIKEKYGELRVYVGGDGVAPENLKNAIESADARSRAICEIDELRVLANRWMEDPASIGRRARDLAFELARRVKELG